MKQLSPSSKKLLKRKQGGIMTEKPIEEVKTATRIERFAQWLMSREERRSGKETNLDTLVKLNVLVSFLTLAMVGGIDAVRAAVMFIPYF